MRVEDKELEGPELERAHRLEVEDARRGEEELPVFAGEEVQDLELEHRGRLLDAIQRIMRGEQLTLSQLQLPQRATFALEFLQTAASGRDGLGEFVYAEDRRALLEQALAVLQQNLTHGSSPALAELHARFDNLTSQVGELRGELLKLEDAQDDLFEQRDAPSKAVAADETDGDADAEPANDLARESVTARSTLEGPERPAVEKPASTVYEPEPTAQRPGNRKRG